MSWTDPYAVLDVARGSADHEVKLAYRRALLTYHPDKAGTSRAKYTIDDVNEAYKQVSKRNISSSGAESEAYDAIINYNEVVDLGSCTESVLADGSYQWTRGCRCGEAQGYLLLERDLELNGDCDEIAVQCAGCSIWILVQYDVE